DVMLARLSRTIKVRAAGFARRAAGVVMALAVLVGPVYAHHSYGGIYLESDTIEIDGDVVEFQYKNPHSWIQIDAQDPLGRRTLYSAEWGSVPALERQG